VRSARPRDGGVQREAPVRDGGCPPTLGQREASATRGTSGRIAALLRAAESVADEGRPGETQCGVRADAPAAQRSPAGQVQAPSPFSCSRRPEIAKESAAPTQWSRTRRAPEDSSPGAPVSIGADPVVS
ncbi:unnamed protein product, partial [Ixodes pacificus]